MIKFTELNGDSQRLSSEELAVIAPKQEMLFYTYGKDPIREAILASGLTEEMFWEKSEEELKQAVSNAYHKIQADKARKDGVEPAHFPMDHEIWLYDATGKALFKLTHCWTDSVEYDPIYDIASSNGDCLVHDIGKAFVKAVLSNGAKSVPKPSNTKDRGWPFYEPHKPKTGYRWVADEEMMYLKLESGLVYKVPHLKINNMEPTKELSSAKVEEIKIGD